MKYKSIILLLIILTITSCTTDIPIQEEVVLSNTTSDVVSQSDTTAYATINEIALIENETSTESTIITDVEITTIESTTTSAIETTSIITITEPPIDNYNAADYYPTYIDFNKDGVDEVVYRIPTNSIYNRVCIEINGIEYMFPDIDRIYCYYGERSLTFVYTYSFTGQIGVDQRSIGIYDNSDLAFESYQLFTGFNDTCVIYKPANDKEFKEVLNNNDLDSPEIFYGSEIELYLLHFHDEFENNGVIKFENSILDIYVNQLIMEDSKQNIKLSNIRNYYYMTYMPDEMYLYKRKRLINENYQEINNANLEEKDEFLMVFKHENDKLKVIDGIFLGTEDESYIGQLYKYSYDVENDMYYYCDIEDYITADEFNHQWNIVGNQNIDDRWELVGELNII